MICFSCCQGGRFGKTGQQRAIWSLVCSHEASLLFVTFSSSPELQLEPFYVSTKKKTQKNGTLLEPLSSWTVADKKTAARWSGLTSRAL